MSATTDKLHFPALPSATEGEQTLSQQEQEDEEIMMLQQLWSRRNTLSRPLHLQENTAGLLLDLLPAQDEGTPKTPVGCLSPSPCVSSPAAAPCTPASSSEEPLCTRDKHVVSSGIQWVDAGTLGELPARYAVKGLRPHEMAAVGAYIDPRVVPGFRYRVRTLGPDSRILFKGRALTLMSIGRGYGRRLTFEADPGTLNCNDNHFWTDSAPDGFALELDVVRPGDKFTVMDANHVAAGTLELQRILGSQVEVPAGRAARGGEKAVRVRALCRVEWFESGEEQVLPLAGVALAAPLPRWGGREAPPGPRFINVALGSNLRGFSLTPGASELLRRTTLHGARIGDVPASYTITGLEPHEMPVIGTYVDPRISTGFHYRVRRLGGEAGRWLFGSRALCLLSIGAGYAKRLTFQPDSLNQPNNFFWSDSGHGEGFACEIRGVFAGQRFWVSAGGERLGEASVFRADSPQSEESSRKLSDGSLLKRVRIEVTCHVSLTESANPHQAMRVSGTAVLLRPPQGRARLLRIENVGMDSQLNLLFVRQSASVVFYPMDEDDM